MAAFAFAVAMLAVATIVRQGFGYLGATLYFAPFFPAILVIALVAGPFAGIFSVVATLLLAWWALVPPLYEFGPIGRVEVINFGVFMLSAALIVWLAHRYRETTTLLVARDRDRDLLLNELNHRGRNTFAIVEAIVRNTLINHPMESDAIVGRVHAVSATNDLINHSDFLSVPLTVLLETELKPYGLYRVEMAGDEINLSADHARNLALIFHELTTNAIKYGALKTKEGRLLLSWEVSGQDVVFNWEEKDGPPVIAPTSFGFGSRLLRQSVRALGGNIEPLFKEDGLHCRITFQLSTAS